MQRRSKRSRWEIVYLNAAKCPIGSDEPCLIELIEKGVSESSFRVTDDFSVCMKADVILIDVQTPVDEPHIPQSKGTKDLLVVEGVPLDNMLRVSKADLLKIDAVGSEHQILMGAQKTLERIRYVVLEASTEKDETMQSLIEEGFKIQKLKFASYILAYKNNVHCTSSFQHNSFKRQKYSNHSY